MTQSKLIQDLARNLKQLSETLMTIAGQEDGLVDTSSDKKEVAQVSIEQVRAVLAEVSQAGGTSKVKELLGQFGATKLSSVDPSKYTELLEAASHLDRG